jgi:hypothetical protein
VRKLSGLFILAVVLSSCSTTYLPYPYNYPLRSESFLSRDSIFTGLVPRGWFYSSEDSLAPACAAWVVKEDFSATLAVRELHLDTLTAERVRKEGLGLLAKISMASQSDDPASIDNDNELKVYKMRKREYCGYEVTENNIRKRVVVFTAVGRYYECVAVPAKKSTSQDELTKMFTAQQTFLSSLRFE